MGLLDGIEKIINEHGSATILRERISLAEDKYSALERKAAELEKENKTLKSEVEKSSKEIKRLNEIINSTQKDQSINKPKEIEEQILKLFFETNQEFYASNIANHFNMKIGVVEYHLNRLLELNFIGDLLNMVDDTRYYIKPKGREYIVENT